MSSHIFPIGDGTAAGRALDYDRLIATIAQRERKRNGDVKNDTKNIGTFFQFYADVFLISSEVLSIQNRCFFNS